MLECDGGVVRRIGGARRRNTADKGHGFIFEANQMGDEERNYGTKPFFRVGDQLGQLGHLLA